jgi:hypothetical protein
MLIAGKPYKISKILKLRLVMKTNNLAVKIKCVLVLLILMVIEISPIPIFAVIGLFIVLFRPRWFVELVDVLYER